MQVIRASQFGPVDALLFSRLVLLLPFGENIILSSKAVFRKFIRLYYQANDVLVISVGMLKLNRKKQDMRND